MKSVLFVGFLFSVCIASTVQKRDAAAANAGPDDKLDCKMDIVFVVDSSRSIYPPDFQKKMKPFMKDFVDGYEISNEAVRFSGISFSDKVRVDYNFDDSLEVTNLIDKITNIPFMAGGNTKTYDAIEKATELLKKDSTDDRQKVMIVFSDGVTNPGHDGPSSSVALEKTQKEASTARKEGIKIFAVGIGQKTNETELKGIASKPDNDENQSPFYIRIFDYSQLYTDDVKSQLAFLACVVKEPPIPSPPEPKTDEEVPQNDEDVTKLCQGKHADVMFVLDESTSISGQKNFNKELKFVSSVVDMLDIGDDLTQVGLMTFSTDPRMVFSLSTYTNKKDLLNAVKAVRWKTGNTFTHKALEMLKDKAFSTASGDRQDKANIGILITDGFSTDPYNTTIKATEVLSKHITMFAIGIGDVNIKELSTIATDPDNKHVFNVSDLEALETIKRELAFEICKTSENKEITVDEICEENKANIVFIMDSSTSIGEHDFMKSMKFVSDFIDVMNIGDDGSKVGMMTFSDYPKWEFKVNKHLDKSSLKGAVSQVKYQPGSTKTHRALELLLFDKSSIDIGIVVTDGNSQYPKYTVESAKKLRDAGMKIIAIGVGHDISEEALKYLSGNQKDTFKAANYDTLQTIVNVIARKTCTVGKAITESKKGFLATQTNDVKKTKDDEKLEQILDELIDMLRREQ